MLPHLDWWKTKSITRKTLCAAARSLILYDDVLYRLDHICSYTLMVRHEADSSLHPHSLVATSDKNINNQVGTSRERVEKKLRHDVGQ